LRGACQKRTNRSGNGTKVEQILGVVPLHRFILGAEKREGGGEAVRSLPPPPPPPPPPPREGEERGQDDGAGAHAQGRVEWIDVGGGRKQAQLCNFFAVLISAQRSCPAHDAFPLPLAVLHGLPGPLPLPLPSPLPKKRKEEQRREKQAKTVPFRWVGGESKPALYAVEEKSKPKLSLLGGWREQTSPLRCGTVEQ